jgi:aryl-alcohol dehydrogenase-like predicted oxidoreductase
MRRARITFLAGLIGAGAVGFFYSGAVLYRSFIGLDPVAFPAGDALERIGRLLMPDAGFTRAGVVLAIGTLLATCLAVFVGVWRARRADLDPERRRFLSGAASGAAAAAVAAAAGGGLAFARAFFGLGNGGRGWRGPAEEIFGAHVQTTSPTYPDSWKGARVQAYRRLGRTGFQVSDISLGTGAIRGDAGEAIVREALERGVNYLDTSPDYSGSGSEQAIGRALRGRDRSQLFLATKFCTPRGHLPPGTPVATYVAAVEASLSRLGTDYVDLVHVHSCDEIDRLMDPHLHEAFDQLRAAGKARFLGFSSHTPNLVQVADRAIASGRFDVMMLAYHHGIWPTLDTVIARARRERDMGVVAMKTLKGAREASLAAFQQAGDAYSQAAFKWVLSNPDVSCLVVSFSRPQHVDEYLHASGAERNAHDVALLERYDAAIAGTYCSPHCGACLDHCSEGLPIADVLRYRMYFEDYGLEKRAVAAYAKLGRNAEACIGCSAPCAGRCPLGVSIQDRMLGAHELLSLG